MLIEMECDGKEKFSKTGIKPILNKYDGTVQQKTSESSLQTVQICLERDKGELWAERQS